MNETELVVLGLVHEGAEYAYEIEQRIRERQLRQWAPIAFSSVYYLLHRAEKAGRLRGRHAPGTRGPKTRRYRLTAKGRRDLRQALLDRLDKPGAGSVELAVMFAGALPHDSLRTALQEYASRCRQAAQETKQRWQQLSPSPYRVYQDAIFDHAVAALEAEAAWADRTARRLAAPPSWPSP